MSPMVGSGQNSLLGGLVVQVQPLVQLPLPDSFLGQPPGTNTRLLEPTSCPPPALPVWGRGLHQVLVPGLAKLDQVRFDAVHLLVDLPVVGRLLLQVHLQVALAVHDLADPRLQLVVVLHDPLERTQLGQNQPGQNQPDQNQPSQNPTGSEPTGSEPNRVRTKRAKIQPGQNQPGQNPTRPEPTGSEPTGSEPQMLLSVPDTERNSKWVIGDSGPDP